MKKKYFPTSTHYFPSYINSNAVYIDKTQFIVPLLENEGNATYFLSRPRRFGKSLFLSTLEQVFSGKKDLFQGLYIYDKIEWDEFPAATLPAIITSVARLTASTNDSRQPYKLSNFDFVTLSFTLIAGKASLPSLCI